MIAVIQTGGKQFVVKEGDIVKIPSMKAKEGDKVEFEVLFKAEGDKVEIGAPLLSGKAQAEIVAHGRADKISVVKYKAKSRYNRRVGHRQDFTKVKITKV